MEALGKEGAFVPDPSRYEVIKIERNREQSKTMLRKIDDLIDV